MQGSVQVLGSWSSWTGDPLAWQAEPDRLNHCPATAMLAAVTLLVINWVLLTTKWLLVSCYKTDCSKNKLKEKVSNFLHCF